MTRLAHMSSAAVHQAGQKRGQIVVNDKASAVAVATCHEGNDQWSEHQRNHSNPNSPWLKKSQPNWRAVKRPALAARWHYG